MEHPAQNAGVDQVLKCAQDNLAAFKIAVDTDDVAALRSMLREMDPQYNAACKQYGIPKAPSAKSRQQKAAAALEAKACEVAAGMDVRVDQNGQLVTTVKAVSDDEIQRRGVWLPPVGMDECNGDIFEARRAVAGFLPSAKSAFRPYVKKDLGVQGAGTFSTNGYIDPFPAVEITPEHNKMVVEIKQPRPIPASVQDGGMWMEVKRWNPV